MQCNIDAKGKLVRLVSGLFVAATGLVLLVLVGLGVVNGSWPWVLGVLCLLGGGFQIFEAWAGWCVVRAMGFKTSI